MLNELSVAALIVFVCLLLHVAGLLLMAEWLLRHREYLERNGTRIHHAILMVLLFSGIMLLHTVETVMWAAFYYTRELFNDLETSLYFSLTSYTTIGYGDVLLPQRWRLLGAIEGISGVLLCGISTAFIFAVMSAMFQIRIQQQDTVRSNSFDFKKNRANQSNPVDPLKAASQD
jgi:voltage-gated potassium channel